ncbi:MAG: glycosyltransferase family 1 protein [Candidatus Omnitrophota bacterium]|jgi:glycosyltransferase involved in cell wall biosynthesis|nr:MAG: glycosyltransferase family 1 protein [Candidatus Omnitrophota bacterium]
MRILNVINRFDRGGAELLLYNFLVDVAKNTDIDIDVCTIFENSHGLDRMLEGRGITCLKINERHRYRLKPLQALKDIMNNYNYDIVHAHLFPAIYYVGLLARLNRSCCYIMTEHSETSRRNRKILRPMEAFIYNSYDTIVCVSNNTKNNLVARLPGLRPQLNVIYNGAPPWDITARYSFHERPIDIVTVASMRSEVKGIDVLIRAVSLTNKAKRVYIIGDGPYRCRYEELTRSLGLDYRITFLGEVSNIPEFHNESKLFVLPSRNEGFGISILEAMGASLPVIASNVGGIPELVVNGETGILVEPENPERIAREVDLILGDEERAREMGRKGWERAVSEFSMTNYTANIVSAYLEVLKHNE